MAWLSLNLLQTSLAAWSGVVPLILLGCCAACSRLCGSHYLVQNLRSLDLSVQKAFLEGDFAQDSGCKTPIPNSLYHKARHVTAKKRPLVSCLLAPRIQIGAIWSPQHHRLLLLESSEGCCPGDSERPGDLRREVGLSSGVPEQAFERHRHEIFPGGA